MFFNKSKDEVLSNFDSNVNGLSEMQIEKNRWQFGENRLSEGKKKSLAVIFAEQFKDLLVIILIAASIISLATGNIESALVILTVIILNAILGTVQYVKAEKSLNSLKKLSSPTAKVIRDGVQVEIDAQEIVAGDIVKVEAGDIVPCDGRLIEVYSLKVNESALTGESEAVEKSSDIIDKDQVSLGDQTNMVFSTSLVTYGRGIFVATAVGEGTELGKIASLISSAQDRKTPLQKSMDSFSKKLSIVIMIICALVFGLSIIRGESIVDALLFAVALAVAAIPEALSSIITISLAIGTSRMAKENAIIKKLQAVEGLGSVSIICSDKTGTLTQNKMVVEDTFCFLENKETLLLSSILCNDTALVDGVTFGDPTETALVDHYLKLKDDYNEVLKKYPRLSELPFDSDRKLMSTLHLVDGTNTMFTKGAPDVLIGRCSSYLDVSGQCSVLDENILNKIVEANDNYSKNGLRVLAFAKKNIEISPKQPDIALSFENENDMTFIGLIVEMDPPREESKDAVEDALKAGIKPIMITGDHKVTATAIAKKIGIFKDGDMALTGLELDALSEEELIEILPKVSVYARVSPDHKIRIVNAWQSMDYIVAMTGDGVNDAPALKQSDIGIAMGITGTEVSKDAADMILTDDNFATIIKSVLNGRNIYENIKNSIKFLLSGNAAGIFCVLYASLAGLAAPFAAVHLLFINLITDSLPALAIGMEPTNKALIYNKPRKSSESIMDKKFLRDIGLQGLALSIGTMIAFYIGLNYSTKMAMTMAFATLCLGRLWHGFNSRGDQSILKLKLFTNMYTIGAFIVGFLLLSLILFAPGLQNAFYIEPMSLKLFMTVIGLSFAPTLIIQQVKIARDFKNGIKK